MVEYLLMELIGLVDGWMDGQTENNSFHSMSDAGSV